MNTPVNLDNIHEMLDGDPVREQELFQIYISTAEECLEGLQDGLASGNEERWRTQAHALKGMSMNLGAATLGSLCAEAQEKSAAPKEDKEKILAGIQTEYARVKTFLQTQGQQ